MTQLASTVGVTMVQSLVLIVLLLCFLPQVLRPPAPPCQELQEEEVRSHQPAAPQEEVEVNSATVHIPGRLLYPWGRTQLWRCALADWHRLSFVGYHVAGYHVAAAEAAA